MSNIPASRRKPTKLDFFNRALNLRIKMVQYLDHDFGYYRSIDNPQYWIYDHIREDIYSAMQDIIMCLTQANTVYITNINEYNERRRLMTKAIGDCNYIIQEIQFAINAINIKFDKYTNLVTEINSLITSIKYWRKCDNATLKKLKG